MVAQYQIDFSCPANLTCFVPFQMTESHVTRVTVYTWLEKNSHGNTRGILLSEPVKRFPSNSNIVEVLSDKA